MENNHMDADIRPRPLYDPKPIPSAALAHLDPCPLALAQRLASPAQPECVAPRLLAAAKAVDAALAEVLPGGPRRGCAATAHPDLDDAWAALREAIAAAEGGR